MKKIIFSLVVLLCLGFGFFKVYAFSHASVCTLTVNPQYAPLGTNQTIKITLSGMGMSGSFTVPLLVNYTNTYSFTLPYTQGGCNASVYGTSNRQP